MVLNNMTRVLIVDDDPSIRNLLEVLLRQAGIQTHVAATGEEGLTFAKRHAIDLAILDVMLPGMDGYELCRNLRAHSSTRAVPVLMLTAQAETKDKLAGFNAGADDYLTKPFEPDELVARVRALLARSQAPVNSDLKLKRPGQLWAVFGAKGGSGKTTVAVNLAVALARNTKTSVALVDADFLFGDVGSHLNLSPSRTILDLLPRLDQIDEHLLSQVMIRHNSNVHVLLAPFHPEDAERIPADALRTIAENLTDWFDYVIVDCPTNYDERTLCVLESADEILYMLTPEMGPVKNASTFLDLAAKMQIPSTKIRIVLNRANSDVGIGAAEIERALQKPIPLRLVSGGRPLVMSVNRGIPLTLEQPKQPFAQQITRIAEILTAPGARSSRA